MFECASIIFTIDMVKESMEGKYVSPALCFFQSARGTHLTLAVQNCQRLNIGTLATLWQRGLHTPLISLMTSCRDILTIPVFLKQTCEYTSISIKLSS